jgi:hypothetical protein
MRPACTLTLVNTILTTPQKPYSQYGFNLKSDFTGKVSIETIFKR